MIANNEDNREKIARLVVDTMDIGDIIERVTVALVKEYEEDEDYFNEIALYFEEEFEEEVNDG